MADRRKWLNDFFAAHVGDGETLQRLLRDTFNTNARAYGDELVDAVCWGRSRAIVFHDVARAIVQRGMANGVFFAALRNEYPLLSSEVAVLQRSFGVGDAPIPPEPPSTRHWIDRPVFDWSDPQAQELSELLVNAYPMPAEVHQLLAYAGIDGKAIELNGSMRVRWHNIINAAARAGKLHTLCEAVLADTTVSGYHARLQAWLQLKPG